MLMFRMWHRATLGVKPSRASRQGDRIWLRLHLAPLAGQGTIARVTRSRCGGFCESELVQRPPILIDASLCLNSAANSSPPPCGEGKGCPSWVGVARGGIAWSQPPKPPPPPPPPPQHHTHGVRL